MRAASTASAPRSDRRRLAGLLAGLLIFGFLAWSLVSGWRRVADYDWQLDIPLLVAGIAVLLVFYAASGIGFVAVLEALGPSPPRRATMSIWAKSLLGRYVPGNILMVVGRVVLLFERGVARRVALAATVYEQALALGVAAALGVVLLAVSGSSALGPAAWALAVVPVGLVFLHPKLFGPISAWLLRLFKREPLPQLLRGRVVAYLAAWYALTALVLGVGIWLLVISAAGGDDLDVWLVSAGFLLSFVVSMLAFVFPSGIGVREGAFALALATALPGAVAITLAVGVRLVLTLVELAYVGAAVLAGRRA